ncbi:MAG TPA: GPW/gp25 family protein [Thermoanaerobaculia bacterium]|nr:GPW/gp25 family protein [Thermoanaerobaculia bacterium]
MVTEKTFLGTGWVFPPTFSRRTGSVDTVGGDLDIHESLAILFSTSIGERVMLPTYGTDLWRLVFGTMTVTLQTEIGGAVRQAILMWEPRIDVLEVNVQADPSLGGTVLVEIDYVVRQTNSRSNFVYPFYLQEGTLAPLAS